MQKFGLRLFNTGRCGLSSHSRVTIFREALHFVACFWPLHLNFELTTSPNVCRHHFYVSLVQFASASPLFLFCELQLGQSLQLMCTMFCRSKGSLRRIWSLGALGEGSGWDLRVRLAASGNLGTWKSGDLEIWVPGNPEIWGPTNQKHENSQNQTPFCPKCRQGLD